VLPTIARCCARVRVKWRQECVVDEFLRAAWRLLFAGRVDAERLVFVDLLGAPTPHSHRSMGGRAEARECTSECRQLRPTLPIRLSTGRTAGRATHRRHRGPARRRHRSRPCERSCRRPGTLQRVASMLTCPLFDAPWADQIGPTSSPRMCIMRCGSCPLKPAVLG
jgi:hypothetical protein